MWGDDGKYRPANTFSSAKANYHFAYSVDNQATGDVKQHSETRNGNQVHGSYFVLEPDGGRRLVEYTADERGFRPRVQRRYERQVPAPYKNYHVNLNNAKRFYPVERQGLHTSTLTHHNSTPISLSTIQQSKFENLLLRSRAKIDSAGNSNSNFNLDVRGNDWTVDDRYSRPTIGKTTYRNFHERLQLHFPKQNAYNVKRIDYPLAQNHADIPQSQSPAQKEPIYIFDIRRAVSDSAFRSHIGK